MGKHPGPERWPVSPPGVVGDLDDTRPASEGVQGGREEQEQMNTADFEARNAEDAELEAEARMYEQCREMVNTIAQAADNMMDAQYIENFDGDITG